jgi:hypothetical protein
MAECTTGAISRPAVHRLRRPAPSRRLRGWSRPPPGNGFRSPSRSEETPRAPLSRKQVGDGFADAGGGAGYQAAFSVSDVSVSSMADDTSTTYRPTFVITVGIPGHRIASRGVMSTRPTPTRRAAPRMQTCIRLVEGFPSWFTVLRFAQRRCFDGPLMMNKSPTYCSPFLKIRRLGLICWVS